MQTFPVLDNFEEVGNVRFEKNGLYYTYESVIRTSRIDFVRLYANHENESVKLGLYIRNGEKLYCRGRVSARSLKYVPEHLCYSLQNAPNNSLLGVYCSEKVRYCTENGRQFWVVQSQNRLPEEIMPYFCFLQMEQINGEIQLVINPESIGIAGVSELMPE